MVDEGFEVCDPAAVVLDVDGLVLDDDGELEADGVDVDVESCWRCAGGLLVVVLGEDWAKAEVAMATKALVANNRRLFI